MSARCGRNVSVSRKIVLFKCFCFELLGIENINNFSIYGNEEVKQSHVICLATIGIGNAYELDWGIHLSLI